MGTAAGRFNGCVWCSKTRPQQVARALSHPPHGSYRLLCVETCFALPKVADLHGPSCHGCLNAGWVEDWMGAASGWVAIDGEEAGQPDSQHRDGHNRDGLGEGG